MPSSAIYISINFIQYKVKIIISITKPIKFFLLERLSIASYSLEADVNKELNMRIYDGNHIKIKKSTKPVIKDPSKAIFSNLNPKFLIKSVTARIENP